MPNSPIIKSISLGFRFSRKTEKGQNVYERSPSSTYRLYDETCCEKGGAMPRVAKNAYKGARRQTTQVDFEESKTVLVILKHLGSKSLSWVFKPISIVMDAID